MLRTDPCVTREGSTVPVTHGDPGPDAP